MEQVVIIVIVGCCTGLWIVRAALRHEETKMKLRAGLGDGDAAGLKALVVDMDKEIHRLRDRVAVLEKLATDDDRKLAAEISRLGSRPTNPPA